MKRIFLSIFALLMVAPTFAHAQGASPLTVVELFTSQGCSSCPPADAVLKNLRAQDGVLTLSWPVHYWDRLGWEDTFADPDNAKRQAAYNKRLGRGGVFTPQMIFDGVKQCVGSNRKKVDTAIADLKAMNPERLDPSLEIAGDQIIVRLPAGTASDIMPRLVWFTGDATVEIGDGENQGRMLHYTNVVRETRILETRDTISVSLSEGLAAGADHVAVLMHQTYGHGAILGAAFLPLSR